MRRKIKVKKHKRRLKSGATQLLKDTIEIF